MEHVGAIGHVCAALVPPAQLWFPRPCSHGSVMLNAAARLVSDTRNYDCGLMQFLHADLHWLDVANQVSSA